MPIYEFQCVACRHLFEDFFTKPVDKPTAKCPECGGKGKKIISNVGLVFKGGGFYVTDSRTGPAAKSDAVAKRESGAVTTEAKPESPSAEKTESPKPAATDKPSSGNDSE